MADEQHLRRRTAVGTRLLVAVLLPVAGVLAFSAAAAVDSYRTADAAGDIVVRTGEAKQLLDAWLLMRDERVPSETILAANRLGVPLQLVNGIIGYDVEANLRSIRSAVDGSAVIDTSPTLSLLRSRQQELRTAVDTGSTDAQPSRVLYDDIDRSARKLWTEAVEGIAERALERSGTAQVQPSVHALDQAADLLIFGANETVQAADLLVGLDIDAKVLDQLVGTTALRQRAADELSRQLGDNGTRAWSAYRSAASTALFERSVEERLKVGLTPPSLDPAVLGPQLQASLDRMILLKGIVEATSEDLVAEAEVVRTAARSDFKRSLLTGGVAALVTLVLTWIVAQSITRPLRRLERQARGVSDGDLDVPPLGVSGPREVAVVADAFDQLVANLKAVDGTARLLAEGDLDDPRIDQPLRGRLGDSLRQSVDRLSLSLREGHDLRLRLAQQATHDSLTGLLNRSAAVVSLERALARDARRGAHTAVLFVDLDWFKAVNDVYGHAVGDRVLRVAADRIERMVRTGDTVARLGGDEFVVILEEVTDALEALTVAERVLGAAAEPIVVDHIEVLVGTSVGLAMSVGHGDDALELLRKADLAMYRAKALGKGRVEVFDEALQRQLEHRATIEEELRIAMREHRLELHYQPVVDVVSGRTTGFEALVRWRRPDGSLVAPIEFVPIAELSDLVVELDLWVLAEATRQLVSWRESGLVDGVHVAVNVSGRHLGNRNFVDHVLSQLRSSRLDASALIIEVTETVLLDDLAGSAEKLADLRRAGVRIAIDDFGTGYTSLGELRNLPADIIKVDRSFVAAMQDPMSGAILQLVVDLASMMGIDIIAEGVESREQFEELRRRRCRYVQGYGIARPMPACEVEAWLATPPYLASL